VCVTVTDSDECTIGSRLGGDHLRLAYFGPKFKLSCLCDHDDVTMRVMVIRALCALMISQWRPGPLDALPQSDSRPIVSMDTMWCPTSPCKAWMLGQCTTTSPPRKGYVHVQARVKIVCK